MPISPAELHERARRIRLLLLDVDGVLTDGTVHIHSAGGESKAFSIRDGAAIVWARAQGLEIGLLSGRASDATSRRAAELGIELVVQGQDKPALFAGVLQARAIPADAVCYVGDDIQDLPVLAAAGLSAAPADAAPEVRERVHWISRSNGGRGAVREIIEVLLRARGSWETVLKGFSV
jgi:3-deoxy-D-manno-octulosonate 8-phosphate phosphatase (KDO 8-P phosphatase)